MSRWLSVLVLWLGWAGATQAQQPSATYQAEAFLGTWEWRSGNEVFRLTLTRNRTYALPNNSTLHVLLGQHAYTRNGVLVESSFTPHPVARKGWSLMGTPDEDWNIRMGFLDLTKNKGGDAELTINPSTPNQLTFVLRPREIVTVGNQPHPPAGFTIPTSMTLTRVP